MKKIKIIWALACNSSSTDQQTNTLSLFNILEEMAIEFHGNDKPKPEGVFPSGVSIKHPFEIVIMLSRVGKDNQELNSQAKIELVDPLGKSLAENMVPIKIEENKKRLRVNIKVDGIKVTMAGEYEFKISLQGNKAGEYTEEMTVPLEVKFK